jgi:hypothetical protein
VRISGQVFEQVRVRADRKCEYCSVSESDSGGLLTIDHFQPRASAGKDSLDNLVYACFRCNNYKQAFWEAGEGETPLWNPRRDSASSHFAVAPDGLLIPLDAIGQKTIEVLRLNRSALIDYRLAQEQHNQRDEILRNIIRIVKLRLEADTEQIRELQDQSKLLQVLRDILTGHDSEE